MNNYDIDSFLHRSYKFSKTFYYSTHFIKHFQNAYRKAWFLIQIYVYWDGYKPLQILFLSWEIPHFTLSEKYIKDNNWFWTLKQNSLCYNYDIIQSFTSIVIKLIKCDNNFREKED